MRKTAIIGVASGAGARDPGCADGPESLQIAGVLADLQTPATPLVWEEPIRGRGHPASGAVAAVADIATQVAERVQAVIRRNDFPLVIGGDHSIAIGTWSGVRASLPRDQRLGLLWIDAHLDSHTFATTPTRAIHGMPLACLLGRGEAALTTIAGPGPKVLADDICLIGARSFEWKEMELLKTLGARIYFMPEIRERGVATILDEAIDHVTANTASFGISFDLDAFDPSEEAATGTPVAGGLFRADVLAAMEKVRNDPRLGAMEIVEYNPHRDADHATARAIHDLCQVVTR
ncbi:MAG: arginase [Sulfurisoma sp.]|nr:arginase [Sulfurisoma sp.]